MNLDSFIENEDLNDDEAKKVKEYIESIKKSREKQGNEECIYWKRGCNNQICPMLNDNSRYIWYSDEDTCSNPEYRNNIVVINQKKLKKKNAPGYFTYNMLNRNFVIKKGITGIDPDVPDSIDSKGQKSVDKLYNDREESWFKEHPELTREQIEKNRKLALKGSEALKKYRGGRK
ncbi:hypothetical protein [Picrophilus oshimae]|uniref:Uncharacterized protein n=1 Tax=Picrophilus torridus (strain ATCC 700027 / DSM 9790 / JCM 10055 / NBRC 100828 / KAW 2/3) TaxID=1122961 RepID=Q6L264_PICTO|nr:hypothetical protein [Picrophilus oshimae]AAT42938.1 hypothetical protein PTO0353 [Picrophilus oshimae DSM 9789]